MRVQIVTVPQPTAHAECVGSMTNLEMTTPRVVVNSSDAGIEMAEQGQAEAVVATAIAVPHMPQPSQRGSAVAVPMR